MRILGVGATRAARPDRTASVVLGFCENRPMALFRRRRPTDSTSAAAEFWESWPEVRQVLAEAVESDRPAPAEASEKVTALVRRIHPDLDWEVGPAPKNQPGGLEDLDMSQDVDPDKLLAQLASLENPSQLGGGPAYALTLRPGPSDDARVQSERWARSAPEDDQWTFRPTRPADHDELNGIVRWDDHEFDLSHVSVSMRVNQASGKIEVGIYHPDNMFVAEETRGRLAEHVTLLALGEDDTVRWIGKTTALDEKPLDPLGPTAMPSVVRQMADMLGGQGGWVTLQGRIPITGGLEVLLRHPLSRREFPALSLFVHVVVPYTNLDGDRLPVDESAEALTELEGRLSTILGENGALFARRTDGGRRQYLYYLDPDSGVLPEFEAALMDWSEGKIKLRTELDPGWVQIGNFRRSYRRQLGE